MDSHLLDMSLRLVIAMVLGGIIGLERDCRAGDAGFRTHFLVAVGSALFTLLSMYGFAEGVRDTSRVAAQVVSGIGFLGAGLIVFQKNVVHGLTTAAGLWVTAAVGMACGTGQYYLSVFVTMLMLIGLELLGHLVPKLGGMTNVRLSFSSVSKETVSKALENIRNDVADVVSFEMKNRHSSHGDLYDVQIEVRMRRKQRRDSLLNYLHDVDDVTIFSEE